MPFDRGSAERVEQLERTVGSGRFVRPHVTSYEALERCSSATMLRVRKLVEQSAASDLPVLVTGELGVRKDLIAREIHRRSARRKQRLFEVNCSAVAVLPNWLAPLGPAGDDPIVDAANHATLYLNGVGELPAALQEELLELLHRTDCANDDQ